MTDLAGRRIWVMAKGYAAEEGGMQTYAEGVAHAYAAAGAKVTVFTQTKLGQRQGQHGAVLLVDVGAHRSALLPWRLARAMRRQAGEEGAPHLVHGTTWRTSLLPMLLDLPYATTFHGREFMYGGTLRLALMRRIARHARMVCAVSAYSAGKLRERLGAACPPITVAWNGLGEDEPLPAPTEPNDLPLVFSLCRLEPRKNIAACVTALAGLRDQGLAFRYVVGGRGPALDEVRALVARLGLADRVEVAGFIPADETARLYAAADIFLHPQVAADGGRDFEGFGIAIADAMAAGCAVVVGAEGGAIELIEEGVTGLAIDGNDLKALEAAIRSLLVDAQRRRQMAQAAQAHARATFRWDRHIEHILAAAGPPFSG
ncbi:glycosyltransferase family 4 protein [Croceibacterium mercuriale]|uniref:glycosyltransferase family 4 protein n=1 Tax=Croceibacterium mercuriale TaxID=1572751 RepID=UPI000690C80C|nr:glycosyltransferase family 4 protein [Croceibacterium mercuriale]